MRRAAVMAAFGAWAETETVGGNVLYSTYHESTKFSFEGSDFQSFGLVSDKGLLTNAGALFADHSPIRYSRIFCTRWNGLTKSNGVMDALDDDEFSGGIITLLEKGFDFVRTNSKKKWRKTQKGRVEYPEYPLHAVRECIVNGLIHRDYLELGSEVHIDMFDDRLEITSPGGMPSGHCVQELDARQVTSKRRNPVIADLFQRLDLMERRGSGFKKILDAYAFESEKRSETVVPRFESTQTDFFLILSNLNYGRKINGVESSSENSATEAATEVNTDRIGINIGGTENPSENPPVNPPVNPPEKDARATLTKSVRAVLSSLESDSSMTYDALAAKLKLHRDTIRVSIASLVRLNLLRRIGSDKTGHWEVVR